MKILVTSHAWQRYEERMRAYVPPEELHGFAEAALEKGQPVPIRSEAPDAFCRMYRRFALVFRPLEDGAALITILPRGERPRFEIRIPEA